jgi:hypothetical protein
MYTRLHQVVGANAYYCGINIDIDISYSSVVANTILESRSTQA